MGVVWSGDGWVKDSRECGEVGMGDVGMRRVRGKWMGFFFNSAYLEYCGECCVIMHTLEVVGFLQFKCVLFLTLLGILLSVVHKILCFVYLRPG